MTAPFDRTKPFAQLHLKQFPVALRIELDTIKARRGPGTELGELVPELLRLGIKALREKEREAAAEARQEKRAEREATGKQKRRAKAVAGAKVVAKPKHDSAAAG